MTRCANSGLRLAGAYGTCGCRVWTQRSRPLRFSSSYTQLLYLCASILAFNPARWPRLSVCDFDLVFATEGLTSAITLTEVAGLAAEEQVM